MRDWLKTSRERCGFTQQEVSEKLGITRQYYNQIETGIRQLKMDITLISKLSNVLGIALEQVVENENRFYASVQLARNSAQELKKG